MLRTKIELVRKHANRNIGFLLKKLNIYIAHDRGDLFRSNCPCPQHSGDRTNPTAFNWRKDIGRWICFTHHCETKYGGDIFGLVRSIKDLSFNQSIHWTSNTLEKQNIDISEEVADVSSFVFGRAVHVHEPLKEDNLKFLSPDPQYLLERGFDINVLRKYEVGFWSKAGTYMHNRVVFPVRDDAGFLVGYTGRTVHGPEYFSKRDIIYRKWVHGRYFHQWPRPNDFFTSSVLYNLFNAKKYLESHGKIILVEGPLDGLKLEEAKIHNWAATFGTNFCFTHKSLLTKFGVKDIYVAYDNDIPKGIDKMNAGESGWEKIKKTAGDLFNLHRIYLPPGRDCGSLTLNEINQYITV